MAILITGNTITFSDLTTQNTAAGSVEVSQATGNGACASYSIGANAPGSENNTWVFLNGVYQQKTSYTISGTTITLDTNVPTGVVLEVCSGTSRSILAPSDGTVTTATLVDGAVTNAKIESVANTKITGVITADQIATVANTQITGVMTAAQIATIANTQITGVITTAQLAATTGTGSVVLATSPTLVTPLLGTPTSGVLTNVTGLPLTTGVTGTLPVANGGTGLTSIAHTVQTFTSGSGTYTLPSGCKAIWVRAVGGGGGGGGTGTSAGNGTSGGDTTFSGGTLVATGGGGGPNGSNGGYIGGAGGVPTGGDMNIRGGYGQSVPGNTAPGLYQGYGGNGGNSAFGGGGPTGVNGPGGTGGVGTSGGGGGGIGANSTNFASAGGGAGGYCEKVIHSPGATYTYAVGAGGAGGTVGTGGGTGGAGGSGLISVTEYYV